MGEENVKITKVQIKNAINKILPNSNFYAYCQRNNESFMEKENKEIDRLIKNNEKNGKFIIKNKKLITFSPVYFEYKMR